LPSCLIAELPGGRQHDGQTQTKERNRMPATRCEVCGKGPQFGAQVSHAHNVSTKKRYPNIQRVRVMIQGAPRHLHVCTRCLRSGKVQKAA
jgi:large subunit ribosomal protein L28